MTVTDCHHEKKAVQEMEHAKKFSLFGKGLQTTDILSFFITWRKRKFLVRKTKIFLACNHSMK